MENATKALTMAGGVLIAIIVIAALVYASSTYQVVPRAQDEANAVRQLSLFNQQYESYVRDALYGTDLVSLLNKAVDNNERYNVGPNEKMYIDIAFKLLTDVDGSEVVYKKYISDGREEVTKEREIPGILKAGKLYRLSSNDTKNDIEEFLNDFYSNTVEGRTRVDEGGKYIQYTQTTSAGSEFKTRIFACKEYAYDSEGRIKYLYFEEQDQKQTEETA